LGLGSSRISWKLSLKYKIIFLIFGYGLGINFKNKKNSLKFKKLKKIIFYWENGAG
jgi:hypothetical protein